MADLWESLGFKESPYDARPLRPVAEDVDLLVGRQNEAIEFCTTLESAKEGITVLAGSPGVGKTSFFNVQQYKLANGQSEFGPKLLPAERLCTIHPNDEPRVIALRVVSSLVRSMQIACAAQGKKLPPETAKIEKWVNSSGGSGFEVGLSILGVGGNFGRSVSLPSTDNVSFEGLQDAIECIVAEAVDILKFDGVFIALDNIENLEDDQLGKTLITFRDTVFMIQRVWWVLVGQSGLGSLIQTLDPRVSDRLSGVGIELKPIGLAELEQAISIRVRKFSTNPNGKSPLPIEIHKRLYDASNGEIRFVFRYSHEICTKFVQNLRQQGLASPLVDVIAKILINNQIPIEQAERILKDIVVQEVNGLNLRTKDKKILRLFGEKREARPKDYEQFGCNSTQDFYSNYIAKLHGQHLLARRQQGTAVYYRLRGIAFMAMELGLLTNGH